MKSQGMGKRSRNQSKYQQSDENRRAYRAQVIATYRESHAEENEAEEVKPKINISSGIVDQITGNIGSYRKSKLETSFKATNSVLQKLKNQGVPESHNMFKGLYETLAPKGFEEFAKYVESDEIKQRFEQIKEQHPTFIAPYESKLYKDIKLLQKAIELDPNNKVLRKQYIDNLKLFMSDQISTPGAVEELLRYYNDQNKAIKNIYEKSDTLKKRYDDFRDFISDFWQLYRQALNKSKGLYESSSLLATMAATDSDYLFENIENNITTQERIEKAYGAYIESGFGRNVPEIAQTYLVQKPKKKASKVESIKPGERVKPRLNKDSDWYESLTSDDDKDNLIGYTPKTKIDEYPAIHKMFPTKGGIDYAREIIKNARKSQFMSSILDEDQLVALPDGTLGTIPKIKVSLKGYEAVSDVLKSKPNFNKFAEKDLIDVIMKYRELVGKEDE